MVGSRCAGRGQREGQRGRNHRRRRISAGAMALVWLLAMSLAPAPAAAMPAPFLMPFPAGQTWYICQGYRGVTHATGYSFDLSTYPAAAGTLGCDPAHASDASGKAVTAAGAGSVANEGVDFICINFDAGGSTEIGHLNLLAHLGDRVLSGQTIGTVESPNSNNGSYAHIHVEAHASSGCASDVPFDDAHSARFQGGPDLPYGPNWTGTALTRPSSLAAPAMLYDVGNGSATVYRWANPAGTSFTGLVTTNTPSFDLANVGNRVASGDFDGDGHSDMLVAYQNANGTFDFRVSSHATSTFAWRYTSGSFSLSRVAGRLVAGDWNADGKDDVAVAYDNGNGTFGLYRWTSTGSGFTSYAPWKSGSFYLSNVGDRMVAGDWNADGKDDVIMAYQNSTGSFTYHV